MTLREIWQTKKKQAEEAFKKEHALEMQKVHTDGLTPFPVKFELGLGPALDSLDSAQKKNKAADVTKYKSKAKDIVGKYKTRIGNNKTQLGTAYTPLHDGITHLETSLK